MQKNRIIIILGIILFFMPELGFTPTTKVFLIKVFAAIVVVLALLIERKGIFSMWWHKKNTITPVARTYVEHNGTAAVVPVETRETQ